MTRPASPPLPTAPERTKTRLLELIKRRGTITAQDIALQLEISVPAARRHLGDLTEHGLIESRTERPSGRGRPQHVFALTERGEAAFPKTYSSLCVDILRHIETLYGEGAVIRVFEARNDELAQQLGEAVPTGLPLPARLDLLAGRLSEQGFDAVIEREGEQLYLVQRNCPNRTVAQKYKALCQAELELYRAVLDRSVERDRTIVCGQGTCRYRIGPDTPGS